VENYCKFGQATCDYTVRANYVLVTQFYRYTLRICFTYCFPTATTVAPVYLSVTLYVHWLSCLASWNTTLCLAMILLNTAFHVSLV